MPAAKRVRSTPTEAWDQLQPLFDWPEQARYELVRPVVLFGLLPKERATQTGVSASTITRHADQFDAAGIAGFLDPAPPAHGLPLEIRQTITRLKAEYPGFSANEIATICFVQHGRRPSPHTVKRVLAEDPLPIPLFRRFPRYREMTDSTERWRAVISLYAEGWSPTSIARYLQTNRARVYQVIRRWWDEGEQGLVSTPPTPKRRARKVDLRTMHEVRKLQENWRLGEFRMYAALKEAGITGISPRTCGRILALHRQLYQLPGPGQPPQPAREKREPKPMPFAAVRPHQYWTVDIRSLPHQLGGGNVYSISILENYSRAMLASAPSRTKDLTAYLTVLYAALRQHGAPEALVSDGEGLFRANQAQAIYQALGIEKRQIDRRQAWQSYIETNFNVQGRMADWHFEHATTWAELQTAHDEWVGHYNYQEHSAHRRREDGRRSPAEVLGWVHGRQCPGEQLDRLFAARVGRRLDRSGYVRIRHWRLYGERGLARQPAAVWLSSETLTILFEADTLAQYQVRDARDGKHFLAVSRPQLYATRHQSPQAFLWEPEPEEWLLVMRLTEPVRRGRRRPEGEQGLLVPPTAAVNLPAG